MLPPLPMFLFPALLLAPQIFEQPQELPADVAEVLKLHLPLCSDQRGIKSLMIERFQEVVQSMSFESAKRVPVMRRYKRRRLAIAPAPSAPKPQIRPG